MPKNTLVDICVVSGVNSDTNLCGSDIEVSTYSRYGPYKQNVLAVLADTIAYFPESKVQVQGSPYYRENEVLCPQAPSDNQPRTCRRSISYSPEIGVLPFSLEVVQNLPSCCFPSGGYVYTKKQTPFVSHLVLTSMEGARTYASHLTFTRAHLVSENADGKLHIVNEQSHQEGEGYFIGHLPMCICLVSSFPYLNTMKECLSSLVPYLELPENELHIKLMHFATCLTAIPVPPQGPLSIEFSLFDLAHTLYPPIEVNRRVIDIDLRLPLFIFSAEDIVRVITCLLTQQRMIFITSNYSLLTLVIEAFLTYIDPIQWRLPYVPVLPTALHDLMEATGPFIMGVHNSMRSQVKQIRKDPDSCIVLVDLDKGLVDIDANTQIPHMPDIVAQSLIVHLKKCAPHFDLQLVFIPSAFTFAEYGQQRKTLMEAFKSDINDAFLDMLVSLFGDVFNFMNMQEQFFDRDAYLNSRHQDERSFFIEVLCSDSFNIFIEDRLEHNDCRDSFAILSERLASQRKTTSKTRSSTLVQHTKYSTSIASVYSFIKEVFKMPDAFQKNLSSGCFYNFYCDELTKHLDSLPPQSISLRASYLYLRGFAHISCGNKLEGLRDFHSLYSTAPELFPKNFVSETIEKLDADVLVQLESEPFYQQSSSFRRICNAIEIKKKGPRKFSKPSAALNRDEFSLAVKALKISDSEELIDWLFTVFCNASEENLVRPEMFTSFYNMFTHIEEQTINKEVAGIKLDISDKVLKISGVISSGDGMGRLILTTNRLLFVREGAREYTLVTPLCDIKELIKYQHFSVFWTGVQALRIINSDRNIPTFCASLKDERDIWLMLLKEMAAGHKASIALSDMKIVEQAANHVVLGQILVAMEFPLSIVSGCFLLSKRKAEEMGSLTDETRESLAMRLDPCVREATRTTVMCVAFVAGNATMSNSVWCGMGSGVIMVYETDKWLCVSQLRYAKSRVKCMCLVSNNQMWAGSYDSVIYVINTELRKLEQQLQNHRNFVSDITTEAVTSNRPPLVWSSSFNGQVFCWNSESRECVNSFSLDVPDLCQIITVLDKRLFCVTNGKIIVVDTSTKECPVLRQLVVYEKERPVQLSFAMKLNDHELWVGTKVKGNMIVWNTETYKYEQVKLDQRIQICCMIHAAYSVWVGNKDGKVFVLSSESKDVEYELHAHTDLVKSICETREGHVITGSSSNEGQLCVWNAMMGFEVIDGKRRRIPIKHDQDIKANFEFVESDVFLSEKMFAKTT